MRSCRFQNEETKLNLHFSAWAAAAPPARAGLAGPAAAADPTADYPARPITLLVGCPAGGLSDTAARILASRLEHELSGARVVVENRGGADGTLAAGAQTKVPVDAYALFLLEPRQRQMAVPPSAVRSGYRLPAGGAASDHAECVGGGIFHRCAAARRAYLRRSGDGRFGADHLVWRDSASGHVAAHSGETQPRHQPWHESARRRCPAAQDGRIARQCLDRSVHRPVPERYQEQWRTDLAPESDAGLGAA